GQQILQQIERRHIEPLQIIEEEREWMLRLGKHPDKSPKHHVETTLRLLGRKLRYGWLISNNELQLGDEVDHEPSVPAQCVQKSVSPCAELGVVPAQKEPHKSLKGLGKTRIRDIALVLIELAGSEQTARRHQRLVQFVDNRRLANPGISGN